MFMNTIYLMFTTKVASPTVNNKNLRAPVAKFLSY